MQDDPVSSYLRKYGRTAAKPADPVGNYLQKYGPPDTSTATGRAALLQQSPANGPEGVDPNNPASVDSFLQARAQLARNATPTQGAATMAPPTPDFSKLSSSELAAHTRRLAFGQEPSRAAEFAKAALKHAALTYPLVKAGPLAV